MGIACEVVHFDTAATVNLPLTEFTAADMPKQIILLTSNFSALGSGLSPTMAIGFENSSGGRFAAAQAYTDNQTNQARASAHVDTLSYGFQFGYQSSVTGQTIVARATATAWAANQITLTFSLVPGTPIKCAAIVLGGSDFTPGTPFVVTQNGTTLDQDVTNLGFDPNVLFVINGTVAASGETAHSWIGLVDADGNQMATWGLSNGFGNGVRRKQRLDCIGLQSWNGAEYSRITWKSWLTGGVKLGHPVGYSGARYIIVPMRIAPSGGRAELDVQSWSDTALKTQAVSNGHTPIGLFGVTYCGAASATDLTTGVGLGIGGSDFTTHVCSTLFVTGTHPSVSRCGGHFDNDSYVAGFSAHNTEAHQLVPSSAASGQYVIYPAIAGSQETGTLAFLSKDESGNHTQGYPFVQGAFPMLTRKLTDGGWSPLGYQQVTGLSSAQALTVPALATVAVVQVESQNVRWRDDGTNPTTSVGMQLEAGYSYVFSGGLSALRFIEETATAKLNVSYYR